MYDLLIKNGLVYDGKGNEAYIADVAVKGEKISKIGEIDEKAKKVIDAKGKIVDGSGKKPFIGDVAIDNEKISVVGIVENSGKEEIDAKGNLGTPGWVGSHTH